MPGPDTLPGMPLAVGDPGVFVCGPADIAPWEHDVAPRRPVRPAAAPAPRPLTWLVLGTCPRCSPRLARYCSEHDAGNWWLTNWGRR